MSNAPAAGSLDPRIVIPDHLLGWGPVSIHSRYLVDAAIVIAAVGALFVSLFLIAQPDVSALVKKAVQTGASVAPVAL